MKQQILDILDHLNKNQPVVVATIVGEEGSSPRSSGAKMVVHQDGSILGSVGGGLLEAWTLEAAEQLFQGKGGSGILAFDLTPGDLDTMGMTCGGRIELLLDLVTPEEKNLQAFSQWLDTLNLGQASFFLTRLVSDANKPGKTDHAVLFSDGALGGNPGFGQKALKQIHEKTRALKNQQILVFDEFLVLMEPSLHPKALYIFGAGHVAIPTAEFADRVGFTVRVIDDREEFASPERFPDGVQTRVIPDFDSAFEGMALDTDDFIVIITRGHLHDQKVLAQALKTQARYIGMIGSRTKREAVYNALIKEGFSRQDLDRVHCPIGLAIGAETPEEIAVSIVAELIQVRAKSSD